MMSKYSKSTSILIIFDRTKLLRKKKIIVELGKDHILWWISGSSVVQVNLSKSEKQIEGKEK